MTTASSHQQVLSVTEVLLRSLRLYARHALLLVTTAVLPQLIFLVLLVVMGVTMLQSFVHLDNFYQLFTLTNVYSVIVVAILVAALPIELWGIMALLQAALHISQPSSDAAVPITVRQAFTQSIHAFLPFVGWGLLTVAAIVAGYLIGFVPLVLLEIAVGALFPDQLVTISALLEQLLTLGAFITTTYILFTACVILDQRTRLVAGVNRSIELVRGHFWPLAVRLLFGGGLLYMVAYLIQFIPWFSTLAAWIIVLPLAAVYVVVLYRDLDQLQPVVPPRV